MLCAGLLNFVFCDYEEQKLSAAFGPEFRAYRGTVRRWI
jgi:protein-S-isoprenylcysteine O-methyltransferase Ste14